MQIANIILALGGDTRNTVPKYGVTVSEIAVLRAIHGDDAVTDIDPVGNIGRTSREEIARLKHAYPKVAPDGKTTVVTELFPGASPAFKTFDDLEIDPSMFKPVTVMTSEAVAAKAKQDPLDHDNDGRKGGSLPRDADPAAPKMSETNPERQRGAAKPGRKNRTKAEIAEDEAADEADAKDAEERQRIAREDAELAAQDAADGFDDTDIMG